jgi:hypothetical protein
MIDNPGQLIALRLTEYYEMINQGIAQAAVHAPATKSSPEDETPAGHEQTSTAETHTPQRSVPVSSTSAGQSYGRLPANARVPSTNYSETTVVVGQITGKMRALRLENENILSVSSDAEQNADEAADYWSTL